MTFTVVALALMMRPAYHVIPASEGNGAGYAGGFGYGKYGKRAKRSIGFQSRATDSTLVSEDLSGRMRIYVAKALVDTKAIKSIL